MQVSSALLYDFYILLRHIASEIEWRSVEIRVNRPSHSNNRDIMIAENSLPLQYINLHHTNGEDFNLISRLPLVMDYMYTS